MDLCSKSDLMVIKCTLNEETATTCCPSGQVSGSAVVAGDLSRAKISHRAEK